jgi:hypothetical protein
MSNKTYTFMVVVFNPKEVLYLSFTDPDDLEPYMEKTYPSRRYEVREKGINNA